MLCDSFPHFWQNYITSVFYIYALMLFPFPAGVILVQIICISLIIARLVTLCLSAEPEQIGKKKKKPLLFIDACSVLTVTGTGFEPVSDACQYACVFWNSGFWQSCILTGKEYDARMVSAGACRCSCDCVADRSDLLCGLFPAPPSLDGQRKEIPETDITIFDVHCYFICTAKNWAKKITSGANMN